MACGRLFWSAGAFFRGYSSSGYGDVIFMLLWDFDKLFYLHLSIGCDLPVCTVSTPFKKASIGHSPLQVLIMPILCGHVTLTNLSIFSYGLVKVIKFLQPVQLLEKSLLKALLLGCWLHHDYVVIRQHVNLLGSGH